MGLIERLFGRADTSSTAPLTPGPQMYPITVPYVSGASALGLSAVYRCVTILADAIAGLPWREVRGDEDAPIPLPTSRLVRRPMATMTRREWVWRVVATEALYSTCYLLKVGGYDSEGVPWSLLPVPPSAIAPADPGADPWGLLPPRAYMVGGRLVQADDLVVIRRTPFPGIPEHVAGILELARREFAAALAADTHLERYWRAGGPTTTVITTDQPLEPDDAEQIAQRWIERRARGADYPAVLGKGATAAPFGADPTTDSAVESRRELVADVGRYFGVPTRLLNAPKVGDSETYANTEDEAVDLERYTLRGYAQPIEDAISELLPGDYIGGRRMVLDPTRLTQGNLESRARAWGQLVQAGIADADEARVKGFAMTPRTTDAPKPAAPALPAAMAGVMDPAEVPA